MTKTLDLDRIVEAVTAAGFAAYVEQTGGGCATVFASREWVNVDDDRLPALDSDGHFDVAAGPGHFDGPGWTNPRASAEDFVVGSDANPDDFDVLDPEGDEAAAVALIVKRLEAAPTSRALLCDRCGREIVPGTAVEFVGYDPEEPDGRNVFEDGELIVVHAECPK
jgi:hypothetical protein